jgi:dTDP-4-amino-4,6-dideoxygalactose transaminase
MAITAVPLLDLKGQYESIREEISQAMNAVLDSQRFILGPEVEALEKEIAGYCGCKHAIGVSSGTDALLVSLMALGIGPGDAVITTPFTFFATVGSILRVGAEARFADINPDTFNVEPGEIEKRITDRTKAIIPVHLFGQSVDMAPILDIAAKHGIAVIEDAAQAIGTEYQGKRAGSMGTVGCFSFFPSKNLGAFGDGGIVTTNDSELSERVRILRNQGSDPKYYHKLLGGNFRLDALQAAVLRVKLRHLDGWTEKRRGNATYYTKRFQELGLAGDKIVPPTIVRERHVFNQYVIRAEQRDNLREFLTSRGVATEIYYPVPMHLQECLNGKRFQQGNFPVSENAAEHVLALPIFPELSREQLDYVASAIYDFYNKS